MPPLQAHAALPVPLPPTCGARAGVCSRVPSDNALPAEAWKLAIEIRVAKRFAGINQGTAHRVSKVVFCAWTMVNAVLAASRRSALERHQLSAQGDVIEQCCSSAVNHRQRILIKLAL